MWASAAPATSPKTDGGILHITGRDMFDHVMPSDEFWVIAVGSSLDGSNRTAQLALERAMDDLAEIPSLPFRLAIADADEYVEGTDGDDLLFREQHAKSLASGTPALLLYQYGLKGLDTTLPLGPSAIKRLVQEAKHKAKKKSKSKKKRRKIVRKHMRRELLDMLGTFFPSKVVEVKGVGRLRKDNSWAKKQKTRKSKSGHPDGAPILTGPVALAMLVDAYSDSKLHEDRVVLLLEPAHAPSEIQQQLMPGDDAEAVRAPPTWLRRLSLLYDHRGMVFARCTDPSVHRRFLGADGQNLPAVFILSTDFEVDEVEDTYGKGFDLQQRAVRVKLLAEYGGVQNVWWDRLHPAPHSNLPLEKASANFVQSVLEGPLGWVTVPRIRDAADWKAVCGSAVGQVTSRKRKSGKEMTPNVDMMSGLCLVGIFQFGDMRGGAELDALRKVASRGFLRIAYGSRGVADMAVERAPIRGFGWILASQQPDLLRHLDLFQTPCVIAMNVKKGLYTVHQSRLPPDPEMIYRFTMSVLAGGRRLTKVRQIRRKTKKKKKNAKRSRHSAGAVRLGSLFRKETEDAEVADIPTWFEVSTGADVE
eukprot:g2716.t1